MKTAEKIGEIEFAPPPTNGVVVAEQPQVPALAPEPTTILNIIDRASRDPSVDIDKMERLILMQERVLARQAQADYDNAMQAAQAGMKAVRADLHNKQTGSDYASYAALDKAIRPTYSKNGFSLSFDSEPATENCIRIVCVIAHTGGHRERRQLDMPADGKGAKGGDVMTKTHATGAAITYGKRYLLGMIFNIAIGDDDDGNGASVDSDVEALAPRDAPRDANGKLLSAYSADRAKKANEFANKLIESLNLSANKQVAKEIWAENNKVPAGKKKSPLEWLHDNSPGQMLRVQTAYENVVGLE